MSYGVKKINEYLLKDGRALLVTHDISQDSTDIQWNHVEDGTIYINPVTGDIKYKNKNQNMNKNNKFWSKFTPDNLLERESIDSNFIAPFGIDETRFSNDAVTTRTIADRNITSEKIAKGAIKTEHYMENSLAGTVLMDGTVNGAKIESDTLNANRLIDRTITKNKIAPKAITSSELADSCIKMNNLSMGCVTDAAIEVGTIDADKLKGAIPSNKIQDAAIVNSKIDEKAVDWKNINDGAIKTSHITDENVTTNKIANKAITLDKIADNCINASKIELKSITRNCLAADSVSLEKLDTSLKTILSNAVVHEAGTARVYGNLQVDNDIKATQANYSQTIEGFKIVNPGAADFAEAFVLSEPAEDGDIVEIDKHGCVKKASLFSRKAIGVVSDNYGMCLDASNEELKSGAKAPIGLIGKLHVNVIGVVKAGNYIISAGDGIGIATAKMRPGMVIGRALEDNSNPEVKKVLCLIQAM